ncbi:hypothetical protein AB0D67_30120, partial [Streptosporangium sp. NPDC048047]|uniref:hypothetical protein n=1 Tax=Streptosporangium sp. NPDC048047 TaxID=3155748 RepID=UPI00343611EF
GATPASWGNSYTTSVDATGAIVLVKCLDEEGHSSWAFRTTDGLSDEELLGALTVRTDLLRRKLYHDYTGDDDDD